MSLFGAMNTAISGLSAQSNAFGNISDNVANSQTIGYKRVDTAFVDYLTTSTAANNVPGAVATRPEYVNNVEGTITQTDNTLGLAITGQGFFAVSKQAGVANNLPTFDAQKEYTRAGDFQMDKNGYLVNSAGLFLNGWPVTVNPQTSASVVNQNTLGPIQVSQAVYNPVKTTSVNIAANLPATPTPGTATGAVLYLAGDPAVTAAATVATAATAANAAANSAAAAAAEVAAGDPAGDLGAAAGVAAATATPTVLPTVVVGGVKSPAAPISSAVNVYDALGSVHTVTLNWVQNAPNSWTVQVNVPDPNQGTADLGSANVTFGSATVPAGTVGDITPNANAPGNTNPAIGVTGYAAGGPATLSFVRDFGSGPQTITVNLGTYGQTNGVTQYAGDEYNLRGLTQDGVPPGSFSSVTTAGNGDISVNYDNGQSRVIARVPVITFNNPNGLQRQDGQAFTVSQDSGGPLAETASTNGAGDILTQSLESSNVDIATEFSKLIVAQRAYTANTKMITTADDMLQQTIDMKR